MSDQSNDHPTDPCPIHGDEPCPPIPPMLLMGGRSLLASILDRQAAIARLGQIRLGPDRLLLITKDGEERVPMLVQHAANVIVGYDREQDEFTVLKSRHGLTGPLVRAEYANDLVDALEQAWGVIANARTEPIDGATDEWSRAAVRFRERYHEILERHLARRPEYVSPSVETDEILSDPDAMAAIAEAEGEQAESPNTLASYAATTAPDPNRQFAIGQRVWSTAGAGMWATVAGYPPSTEHYVVDWEGDADGHGAGIGLCPEHYLHGEDCPVAVNEMHDQPNYGAYDHGHPNSIVDDFPAEVPEHQTVSGDEVYQRMAMGAPIEILYRGEWVDPHTVFTSDTAEALRGLIVAARVPEPEPVRYQSIMASAPVFIMGRTVALIDGQRVVIKRRKTMERPADEGDRITLYFESEGGHTGFKRSFDPAQLIEIDTSTTI